MSFTSWLQDFTSARVPEGKRNLKGRRSRPAATHRLRLEPLEDRRLLAFSAPVDYYTVGVGVGPRDVEVGDFNGDAIQDLAVASYASPGVSVLLGNADGTFQPARGTPAANPFSMVVGDFNQDGKLDLATLSPGVRGVGVLLGQGDGTFAQAPSSDSSVYATDFATGDLDNDGKLDIVLTEVSRYYYGYVSNVEVLLGHGDGTFGSVFGASYDGYLGSPRLADVNGDGNLDVAAAPGTVLLGNGDGTLQDPTPLAGVDLWSRTADFNADGNLDLVSLGNTSLDVSLGNGDGSYAPPIATPLGSLPSSLATADFNGDGRPDVAVTMLYQNTVSVLLNDGHWSPGDPPTVSVRDATLTEGNTGTANATFTVVLSNSTNVDVTVHYSTANVTAAAGSDYTAASGTVTVPAGQASKTFTIAVKGDRLPEPTETFAVNLSAATNATIADGQAIGTILDNEPRISISDVSKSEGKKGKTTLFTFTVTLSAAYDQAVTMSYRTANGTATTSDNDYIAKTGTLTFAPGEWSRTITIEVKGDSKKEANETFYVDLFGLSGNSLFTKNRGLGTIVNDD